MQQQAFKAEAAFKPLHLELLALILRCDVVHKRGGATPGPPLSWGWSGLATPQQTNCLLQSTGLQARMVHALMYLHPSTPLVSRLPVPPCRCVLPGVRSAAEHAAPLPVRHSWLPRERTVDGAPLCDCGRAGGVAAAGGYDVRPRPCFT